MDKSLPQTDEIDVSNDHYRGPSATIAAAGQGLVRHFIWAFLGLLAGGGAAYVFHRPAAQIIESCRNTAESLANKAAPGSWKTHWAGVECAVGRLVLSLFGEGERVVAIRTDPADARHLRWCEKALANKKHGFGAWFLNHIISIIPVAGKWTQEEFLAASQRGDARLTNAVTIGGVFGAFGYVGGWLSGAFGGSRSSNEGRVQYENLRDAHQRLREEHTAVLNERYASQPMESRMPEAAHTSAMQAAEDGQAPHHSTDHAAHAHKAPTHATIDAASVVHHGTQYAASHHHAAL